jgi:hypothetical protein
MSKEAEDLATHVEICAIRYQGIQEQFTVIEDRMDRIETDIREIKASNQRNFDEIKQMLTDAKDQKFNTVVATAGGIVIALLGMLGYIITHLPK